MVPENPAELEAYVATRPPCRGEDRDEEIYHTTGKDELHRIVGLGFGCWMRWETVGGNNYYTEWWTAADHHFCVQIYAIPTGIIKCDPTRDWSPSIVGALRFRVIGDDAIRFEVWDNQ